MESPLQQNMFPIKDKRIKNLALKSAKQSWKLKNKHHKNGKKYKYEYIDKQNNG
jgi:hypothetical protein